MASDNESIRAAQNQNGQRQGGQNQNGQRQNGQNQNGQRQGGQNQNGQRQGGQSQNGQRPVGQNIARNPERERRTPARQKMPRKTEEQRAAERLERDQHLEEISRSVAAQTMTEVLSDRINEAAKNAADEQKSAPDNIRIGENGQPEVEMPVIGDDGSVKKV